MKEKRVLTKVFAKSCSKSITETIEKAQHSPKVSNKNLEIMLSHNSGIFNTNLK